MTIKCFQKIDLDLMKIQRERGLRLQTTFSKMPVEQTHTAERSDQQLVNCLI